MYRFFIKNIFRNAIGVFSFSPIKKVNLIFFLIVYYLMACTVLNAQLKLKATFTGFPDGTKFYLSNRQTEQIIAETEIRNNTFTMTSSLQEVPTVLTLYSTIPGKAFVMIAGNESISLSGDFNAFTYTVKLQGSKYHQDYQLYLDQTRAFEWPRDSVSANMFELIKDTSQSGKKIMASIGRQQAYYDGKVDSVARDFVMRHPDTYTTANLLWFMARKNKIHRDTVIALYHSFPDSIRNHYLARRLFGFLSGGKALQLGDIATDFSAEDMTGKRFQLSDMKGKFVLLDFTQSACLPCVWSIEELKQVYSKYSSQLAVVSFYGDKSKDAIQKSLYRDKPGWLCVWDKKGLASETLLRYGVTGFPHFVLLDSEQKIISTWDGYSQHSKQISSRISKFIGW